MKNAIMIMVLVFVGCTGTLNDVPYTWEDGMPRFEWVDDDTFQLNLEDCRRRTVCNPADIFGYNRF
jgi:hypothetical protein